MAWREVYKSGNSDSSHCSAAHWLCGFVLFVNEVKGGTGWYLEASLFYNSVNLEHYKSSLVISIHFLKSLFPANLDSKRFTLLGGLWLPRDKQNDSSPSTVIVLDSRTMPKLRCSYIEGFFFQFFLNIKGKKLTRKRVICRKWSVKKVYTYFVEEPCEVFIIYLFVSLFVWFWILGWKEAIFLPHRVLLELLLGSSKHVSLFLVLFFSSQFTHCSQINTN